MITCHKEMSCHGHVTFATPTLWGCVALDHTPSAKHMKRVTGKVELCHAYNFKLYSGVLSKKYRNNWIE
jgi:hypothetical protein